MPHWIEGRRLDRSSRRKHGRNTDATPALYGQDRPQAAIVESTYKFHWITEINPAVERCHDRTVDLVGANTG